MPVSACLQDSAGFPGHLRRGGQECGRKQGIAINNAKELFVFLLSDLRQGAERTIKIFYEIEQIAQDRDIKQALDTRVLASHKILATVDEALKLIGAAPVKMSPRNDDAFVEEFRRELAEIQTPEARRFFILAQASHLIHLRIGDYSALISAADVSGHYGVGILLESCLADKVAPGERTRRLIREHLQNDIARPVRLTARAI
jgi:ferritin-like metal-binding protein YciE